MLVVLSIFLKSFPSIQRFLLIETPIKNRILGMIFFTHTYNIKNVLSKITGASMKYFFVLFHQYGLIAIFLLILLEYACFPISSELVLPFSGAIAAQQHVSFPIFLSLSVLAGLLGTSFCYCIGRLGGPAILNQLQKKFPKTKAGIERSASFFQRYGSFSVCFLRILPLCRTYIGWIAGIFQLAFLRFLLASAIGITLWNTVLIGAGYFLKSNWTQVLFYYNEYRSIFLLFLSFLPICLILYHAIFKKNRH